MHLLIATAGVLPPEPVADFAELMLRDGGEATVMSVVQAPRDFLEDLVTEEWRPFDDGTESTATPTEHAEIHRYITERGSRLVAPVVAALASRGIEAGTVFVEGEDAAKSIVDVAGDCDATMIVMGATRQLFAESAWESVSMQVTAESHLPVLLIPAKPKGSETEDEFGFAEFTGSDSDA